MITSLNPNEIFVFGSNLAGQHAGGAARQACNEFGAEWGIGEGLTGQTYAYPTLDENFAKLPKEHLLKSRHKLYATAKALPEKTFLMTKVGCGIAGYDEQFIKELFISQVTPKNIKFPEDWDVTQVSEE